ncbi:MAG: winged helix-turn-helix domain-containing protein [Bacteroidetes bacterium]|nr:winged helix-turn-helix domain-containing protein [Bacteroidota bacterium]
MNQLSISIQQARNIALQSQLSFENLKKGKEGLMQIFDQLGYVQIDTISVINRTHHHTLWIRQKDYQAEMLHELQVEECQIFEYWGHAMSYLPMQDYRYFIPRMRNFHHPKGKWAKKALEGCEHLFESVLERIQKEGPLSSKDFKTQESKGGSWWNWKPAKMALEILFWRGDLMVTERRKFQKVYDLTERVLPQGLNINVPHEKEIAEFQVKRALRAMGIADLSEILKFLQPGSGRDVDFQGVSKDAITRAVARLLEDKKVVEIHFRNGRKTSNYILANKVELLEIKRNAPKGVYFLSPFDNLIIQRNRTQRLFNFDYKLECYTPAAKRKYGYFVLPILWNDKFVGRFDPKADRKKKNFIVRKLFFEPDFSDYEAFLPFFAEELVELARFNACEKLEIGETADIKMKKKLQQLVNNLL